jgi:enterochelin esterase-like enzyme
MQKKYFIPLLCFALTAFGMGCKKKIKVQEDEVYSRHLQRQVKLSIISTPIPDDKSTLNVLFLNDGQDLEKLNVKEITDSLYKKGLIQPLIIVGIIAGNRDKEYGVSENPDYKGRGDKADKYAAFIDDELYPFTKKKAGVRKFKTVVLAGWALGGLSAFDISWNNGDKIDKVGVFSGSFLFTDKSLDDSAYSDADNRILLNKIKSSRKKPKLEYWFYGDAAAENGIRYKDSVAINHTKDLIALLKTKNLPTASEISYSESEGNENNYTGWRHQLPSFLVWAFGK